MKIKFISFITLSICLLFPLGTTAYAQQAGSKSLTKSDYPLVLRLRGRVIILKKDQTKWIKARPGMKLSLDDKLKTGGWGSYVEIAFSKDSNNIVKVFSDTEIVLRQLYPVTNVDLNKGKIYSLIESLEDKSSFEIRTPTAICGARGTGWEVTFNPKTTAGCHQNSIFVKGIDKQGKAMSGELIVKEGFKTTVEQFQKPAETFPVTEKERRSWDSWNRDIEQFLLESKRGQAIFEQMDKAGAQQGKIESALGGKEDFFEIREIERIEERIKDETPAPVESTTTSTTTTTSGGGRTGGEKQDDDDEGPGLRLEYGGD